jgi:hypothetical protein
MANYSTPFLNQLIMIVLDQYVVICDFGFSIANLNSKALGSSTSGLAVCKTVCLISLTQVHLITGRKNLSTLPQCCRFCSQITLIIIYYIIFMLVTLLKVTDTPVQVPNIYLTLSFKLLNFYLSNMSSFSLKCLLSLRLTYFRLPTSIFFHTTL